MLAAAACNISVFEVVFLPVHAYWLWVEQGVNKGRHNSGEELKTETRSGEQRQADDEWDRLKRKYNLG